MWTITTDTVNMSVLSTYEGACSTQDGKREEKADHRVSLTLV